MRSSSAQAPAKFPSRGCNVNANVLRVLAVFGFVMIAVLAFVSNGRAELAARARTASTLDLRIGGEDVAQDREQTRTDELVCNLSLFFSVDPDDGLKAKNVTHLDGRGLLSCKNGQGFATELPVLADLEAAMPNVTRAPASVPLEAPKTTEISLSGNTTPFVISREVNQIYDVYTARQFSWEKSQPAAEPTMTFRGKRNDLVIAMKLTSKTSNLAGFDIKSLKLSFDDQAPDLD